MPRLFTRFFIAVLTVIPVTLLTISAATAKDYKVEAIIVQNLQESVAHESYQYPEIDELNSEALAWQLEPSMLIEEYKKLEESEDYRVIEYFSWGQESLPVSEAAVINLIEVELNGWIKVYARQLLFVNLELDFNGYRMSEKRRIKLDEKHYFDHPKFAVIMQVSRLEQPELENEEGALEGTASESPVIPELVPEEPERDYIQPGESIEGVQEIPEDSPL
ncbi:MAG: CsiV family protein [Pseudomonadota bacterium]